MRTNSFPLPSAECCDRGESSTPVESAEQAQDVLTPAEIQVRHLSTEHGYAVVGKSVGNVRKCLTTSFSIPDHAVASVDGQNVGPDHILVAGKKLVFVRETRKGVGTEVWTDEEFCTFFKITREDLQAWIAQGLKVKQVLDGSLRITETATDEFFRGRVIESPYLSTEEAAAYCNVSKDAFYGRVERRKIEPLPGSAKENRFTREQCDKMMKGGQP